MHTQHDGATVPNTERIQPSDLDSDSSKRRTRGIETIHHLVQKTPIFFGVVLILSPFLVHGSVVGEVFTFFNTKESYERSTSDMRGAHEVPLLRAALHSDPNPSKGGGDIVIDGDTIVPDGSISPFAQQENQTHGEISVYVVREGDALSQIAEMFDVTTNTILWANDIKSADLIQPGDSLVILPITGVRHIVKSGDTLGKIAEKYSGEVEDIMAYNGFTSRELTVGQTVVIPGGEVAAPARTYTTRRVAQSGGGSSSLGFAHPLPNGTRTQGIHGYNGVDFGAPVGTSIRAAADGTVILARNSGWNGGYGTYVVVKHDNGTQTLYAHNNVNYVVAGQRVARGEAIAAVGSTGRSTGPHLHFEVRGAHNPF